MAIDIDGLAVLRAIASNPHIFPDAGAEINKAARALVVKQLKAKAIPLERLRDIHGAIGGGAFVLILDDLGDASTVSLVKRLDKNNPGLKTATALWFRKHLAQLASGAAGPVETSPKPAPAPRQTPKGKQAARAPKLAPEQQELALALKTIKAKELARLCALWREHGEASFALVLENLDEKKIRVLAKKLDKDNPSIETGPAEMLRQRIADLASGAAEPVFKSILDSKAMGTAGRRTRKQA